MMGVSRSKLSSFGFVIPNGQFLPTQLELSATVVGRTVSSEARPDMRFQ
jgi:hypothetical protein